MKKIFAALLGITMLIATCDVLYARGGSSFGGSRSSSSSSGWGSKSSSSKPNSGSSWGSKPSTSSRPSAPSSTSKPSVDSAKSKEAEKYGELAARAAKAGDEKNARLALTKKQAAEKLAISMASETEKNVQLVERLVQQLSSRKDQIRTAELDVVIQEARQTSLNMRKEMMGASSSFTNINSLDQARKELDLYEARLDAKEELSTDSVQQLEQLYSVDTKVDDELKSLMESVKNESVSQASR